MLRGDVFELRSPRRARGREQRGRRYGVVLQATELLALSTVIVAPTSRRARPATFRPEVGIRGERSCVLVEQLGAVDYDRLGEPAGSLMGSELDEVDDALEVVLALAGE